MVEDLERGDDIVWEVFDSALEDVLVDRHGGTSAL